MDDEPTLFIELARTGMLLAAAFGFALSGEQQTAVLAFIPAVIAVVSFFLAWWNRRQVFAPATVQKIADAATFQEPGTAVDIGKPPEGPPAI